MTSRDFCTFNIGPKISTRLLVAGFDSFPGSIAPYLGFLTACFQSEPPSKGTWRRSGVRLLVLQYDKRGDTEVVMGSDDF